MDFFTKHREKIPTNKLPRRFSLYVRILVSGYLLYTVEGLIKDDAIGNAETENVKWFFTIAIVMFTIIAVVMFALAIYNLALGKYEGGKLDAGYNEGEEDTVASVKVAEEEDTASPAKATEEEIINVSKEKGENDGSLTAIMRQSDLMRDADFDSKEESINQ